MNWKQMLKKLPKKKADFFRKTAGIFKFGKFDIKKIYKMRIYK